MQSHKGLVSYLHQISLLSDSEDLVKSNLKYVVSIARRYTSNPDTLLDLIQEGNLGLIKAVENHDGGARFAHWASINIRSKIRNYLFGADALDDITREGVRKTSNIGIEHAEGSYSFRPEDSLMLLIAKSRSLSQKQKEVLKARIEGFTLQEIADTKKVTHEAIRLIERAAIQKLKGIRR